MCHRFFMTTAILSRSLIAKIGEMRGVGGNTAAESSNDRILWLAKIGDSQGTHRVIFTTILQIYNSVQCA